MESKFWSLKGGPHLSATALSLSRCASSSWPSPPQTSPRFRRRRKLRWPRWLGERDVLVDGTVHRLEAADWGASVKEATAATDRRISCFLAKMVGSTVSTQTASHCLTAFHLAHLPLSKKTLADLPTAYSYESMSCSEDHYSLHQNDFFASTIWTPVGRF